MARVARGTELARKMRIAFDLHEAGVSMMRQNLRRRFPRASVRAIDRRLGEWLMHRPGAECTDADGHVVKWPRTRI